jgi:peptide/nickel transport system permease protein
MTAFFLRRAALAVLTGFAVLTLVFLLVRVLPGDPAQVVLGDAAGQAALDAMRVRLGLNLPLWRQYFDFMAGAVQGNWGTSMVTGRPVIAEIMAVLPYTLELTVLSLALGAAAGIPLGVWAAVRRNGVADYVIRVMSLAGLSFPAFVSAVILLLVFAIQLPWFPVISGQSGGVKEWFQSITLPAVSLGLVMAAYITRVTRSAMLEVLSADYVRTALAKGVPWRVVVRHHALRNALIPIITVIGLFLGIQIGNSVLTEIVFNRPGLGKLIVGALNQRDYTMLQGLMVIYTLLVVFINVLTDIAYGLVDPRVKLK